MTSNQINKKTNKAAKVSPTSYQVELYRTLEQHRFTT